MMILLTMKAIALSDELKCKEQRKPTALLVSWATLLSA